MGYRQRAKAERLEQARSGLIGKRASATADKKEYVDGYLTGWCLYACTHTRLLYLQSVLGIGVGRHGRTQAHAPSDVPGD